ncbi:MAG: hypothetical protein EA384_03090 [Spirochaetaceae bacterium]|nr:MAG: hypothetical protein EA384_03090 [Spirochaetaceae bacterium]
MKIGNLLQEGVTIGKKNVTVFAPVLASSVVIWLLMLITVGGAGAFMLGGSQSPEAVAVGAATAFGGMTLVAIVGAILTMLAHGMTVVMVGKALDGQQVDLKSAWNKTIERIVPLLLASVIVGVLFGIGMMLIVLPGLVVAFFLMFTFVSVMVDENGAFESLSKSFNLVKSRLGDCVIFFLLLVAIGFVFGVVNVILGLIPVLGQILGMVVSAVYTGYISILLVMAYRELQSTAATDEPLA